MKRYKWKLNLQLFAEEGEVVDTGVEDASDAEMQEETQTDTGGESGGVEKAFAKRLSQAHSKWEAEARAKFEEEKRQEIEKVRSEFKDYDTYREATEFLQKQHGINDIMTLKEQLELTKLQERAAEQNMDPDLLRRMEELESKAARADELEQQRMQEEEERQAAEEQRAYEESYFNSMKEYASSKDIDPDKLHGFIMENSLFVNPENMEKTFEIAVKAMKHDELLSKLESAEKDGMKKLFQAKGAIPTIKGNSTQGEISSPAPKTFAEARARAMERMG